MKARIVGYHEVTVDFDHWTGGFNSVTVEIVDQWINRHGKQYLKTTKGLTYRIDHDKVTLLP